MKKEAQVTIKPLIRQLNHGVRNMSLSSLASASVAGLLGIAGFVLALKSNTFGKLSSFQWIPSSTNPPHSSRLIPGLQNLGNNCFLNVILQALGSCSYFQPFLQKAIEECQQVGAAEEVDNLSLTIALADLLEELRVVGEGRVVLSPRRVMVAMAHYIPNFSLTSQQDAAEAFLHLLSSLREELLDCYNPKCSSLAELFASSCRIITLPKMEDLSEPQRWQQSFLGPFDGILGSFLTCQSCSSQISFNFESFYSLPLSPVLNGANIKVGCSLEDCLKQFTDAEQVENYRCFRCWHIAGIKYLTLTGANQAEIEKLRTCTEQDSCDCQKFFRLDRLPWSNKFCRALKQICISRCPKILCIHLKRVSVTMFGDPVKLKGHISFPLSLDLSRFMIDGVAIKTWKASFQEQVQNQKPILCSNNYKILDDARKLNYMCEVAQESIYSTNLDLDESSSSLPGVSTFQPAGECSKTINSDIQMQSDNQKTVSRDSGPLDSCLYRLVSVVEHFGRAGSGHYTVHRSVRPKPCEDEADNSLEPSSESWFCISDSEVYSVSQEDVLAAEASLLFYERVSER